MKKMSKDLLWQISVSLYSFKTKKNDSNLWFNLCEKENMSKVDQPGERAHFSFMSCDEDAYLTSKKNSIVYICIISFFFY